MPEAYITSEDELKKAVQKAVTDLFRKELPKILRKAQRKDWLTVDELAKLTGWSRRTIYRLKSENRIPYTQEGQGRVLFNTDKIEAYLRENEIDPLGNKG